jgi:sulfite exporter TauE/SafE
VRRAALLVAGAVLVGWALVALSDLAWNSASAGFGGTSLFARASGLLKGRVPGHPFAVGLFLGLLPCGFLYSAVVAAAPRGSALEGAGALALFGLGTAPALLGVSLADELVARHRLLLNRLSQVFILAMGVRLLWRGLVG